LKVGRFGHVKSSKTGRTDEKDKLKRNCVEEENRVAHINSQNTSIKS